MIGILLVEDNAIVRKGLTELLNAETDFEVAGIAGNSKEALALLNNGLKPDIVVTDMNMPGLNGLELTGQIIQIHPFAGVIILTMHRQKTFLNKALAAGAKGYLLKGEDVEDLFSGIRAVHSGATYVSAGLHADHPAI